MTESQSIREKLEPALVVVLAYCEKKKEVKPIESSLKSQRDSFTWQQRLPRLAVQ